MKKVVEEYDLDWNYKIAHRIADCVVSPDGKYLLYHESGQTPVDLFLYDMAKHKEYNIVHYQPGKEEMFTFYNWDSEDIFFYGTYNIATHEGTVYSREARNYDGTLGYRGDYLTRSFWQEYYSKMGNPLTIEILAELLSQYGKDLSPEHLMGYSNISFGSGIVCWQYFMEDGYVFSIYSMQASDQPGSGLYMILEQVMTFSVDYVDGSWYEHEDVKLIENIDAIMKYLERLLAD